MPERWTEYMPVGDLTPAERNAKDHDLDLLDRSVSSFGFMEPVVIDERTGRLVSGHGRIEYLVEMETTESDPPDCVQIDDTGRWSWLVTRGWRSNNDAHAEAAGIALNRVGEKGGWKPEPLSDMLDQLVGTPLLDAVGFTMDELDTIIAETTVPHFGPVSADEQPRLDEREPVVCPECGHEFHR